MKGESLKKESLSILEMHRKIFEVDKSLRSRLEGVEESRHSYLYDPISITEDRRRSYHRSSIKTRELIDARRSSVLPRDPISH